MTSQLYSPHGIGVYVHFPWCLTKCPYCDFHSIALQKNGDASKEGVFEARQRIPHRGYAEAILSELGTRTTAAWGGGERPKLASIFFGGGTPSLFDPEQVGRIISAVRNEFGGESPEVTLECNPTSVDEEHFSALLGAGVTRVSIGVQALENERLGFLGRLHRSSAGPAAIASAIAAGIPRVSADLIFGVFRQPAPSAVDDALRIAESGVGHISAYALTIEEGTRFGALHSRGRLPLLDDNQVADSFEAVSACLTARGFEHYEISNFAKAGQQSIHNMGYWMGRDYMGLGCGAFGTVQLPTERIRYKNILAPERYMERWTRPGSSPFEEGLMERETIEPKTAMDEALLLGLRTEAGVNLAEVARLRNAALPGGKQAREIDRLVAEGVLQNRDGRLRLGRRHWLLADHVLRRLL